MKFIYYLFGYIITKRNGGITPVAGKDVKMGYIEDDLKKIQIKRKH